MLCTVTYLITLFSYSLMISDLFFEQFLIQITLGSQLVNFFLSGVITQESEISMVCLANGHTVLQT